MIPDCSGRALEILGWSGQRADFFSRSAKLEL